MVYVNTSKEVIPKQKKLEEMNAILSESQAKLDEKQQVRTTIFVCMPLCACVYVRFCLPVCPCCSSFSDLFGFLAPLESVAYAHDPFSLFFSLCLSLGSVSLTDVHGLSRLQALAKITAKVDGLRARMEAALAEKNSLNFTSKQTETR